MVVALAVALLPGGQIPAAALASHDVLRVVKRYPSGWYELSSWQGMSNHGELDELDFGKQTFSLLSTLGKVYLQRKYWDDTDIRLRGQYTSDWSIPENKWTNKTNINPNLDMLPLLGQVNGMTPFDLLFRIDAP